MLAAIAVLGGLAFAQGLARDHGLGDAQVPLDPAAVSDWGAAGFRVFGAGEYGVWLTTVNHRPPFEVPYTGALEVEALDPAGRPVLARAYPPGSTDHVRPRNVHFSPLARLTLTGRSLRPWTVRARVTAPDPAFAGAGRSAVTVRRVREEAGLAGVLNYLALSPGAAAALVSLPVAAALGRRGAGRLALRLSTALAPVLGVAAALLLAG